MDALWWRAVLPLVAAPIVMNFPVVGEQVPPANT
jgi:hypothetical protein